MAEGGPLGPVPCGEDPPLQPPPQPLQLPQVPQAHLQMHWSHFKPEYSG